MNRREREVRKAYLRTEARVLKELARQFAITQKDVNKEISKLLKREQTNSVAYQVGFQTMLADDLGRIADKLQKGNYKTVEAFLEDAYGKGWNGAFYSMDGQGVNLNIGIRPDVGAQILMTAQEVPLSARMYKHIEDMQLKAAAELTRGLSQGKGYREIARNLSNVTGQTYRDMERIVRTEGHRVFETAQLEAMKEAVANGADVVKEWDASLDGRTRPLHRELHGQRAEIDADFEIAGFGGLRPGGFGVAEMDINCRCTATQVANWDYDNASDFDDGSFTDYQNSVN